MNVGNHKMKDEEIILKDMQENGIGQSSWDWEADYHFAEAINAEEERDILSQLLKSATVVVIQIAIHKKFITKLKNRRLRALRKLEKQGVIESWWRGTGERGYSEFGVNRVKTWHLINRATE